MDNENKKWLLRREKQAREDAKNPREAFLKDYPDIAYDAPKQGKNEMEKFTVVNDGDRDLEFEGELVAKFRSRPGYTGTGRWLELNLYKTKAGKFICQRVVKTQWQGDGDQFHAIVTDFEEGIIEFFGMSNAAKELYEDADIDATQQVE